MERSTDSRGKQRTTRFRYIFVLYFNKDIRTLMISFMASHFTLFLPKYYEINVSC